MITHFYQKQETPFASKDELVKQIPFLNKKYLSYKDFANASFTDLFPKEKIYKAYKKQIFELGSSYFENLGNATFKKHQLPFMAQISSVNDIALDDYNNDGFMDVFLVGNNYNINTQLGKLDASHGIILLNNKIGFFDENFFLYFSQFVQVFFHLLFVFFGSPGIFLLTLVRGGPPEHPKIATNAKHLKKQKKHSKHGPLGS